MRDETRACLLSEAAHLEVRADRLTAGAEACLAEAVRLEGEAAARRETAAALRADAKARPAVQELKLTIDTSELRATLDGIIYAAQLTGLVAAGPPRRR